MVKKLLFFSVLFCAGTAHADLRGPYYPTTCINLDLGSGHTDWTNVERVVGAPDSFTAHCSSAQSNAARCSGYGFGLPPNAIIDGIVLSVRKKADSGKLVRDDRVNLYKVDGTSTTTKADQSNYWNDSVLTNYDYGSSTDTWGFTWTYQEINAITFGPGFSGEKDAGGSTGYDLDSLGITVYFHRIPKNEVRKATLRKMVLK